MYLYDHKNENVLVFGMMDARRHPEDTALGYDCSFVTAPPEQFQTECPICLLVLRDPCQAECCGNVFCTFCLNKALRDGTYSCPLCVTYNPTVFQDKHLKRKLSEFQVYCEHRRREEEGVEDIGCAWKGELGKLDEHLNATPAPANQLIGCRFVKIRCKFCNEWFQRCRIDKHQVAACPEREHACPHCDYHSTYEDVTGIHLQTCPQYPTQCPHCTCALVRGDLAFHVNTECWLAPIVCDFQVVGCPEKLTRVEMKTHIEDYHLLHAQLLIDHTTLYGDCNMTQFIPLFKECAVGLCEKNTELSTRNAQLSAQMTTTRKEISFLKSIQLVLVLVVGVLMFKLIHLLYF